MKPNYTGINPPRYHISEILVMHRASRGIIPFETVKMTAFGCSSDERLETDTVVFIHETKKVKIFNIEKFNF